VKRNVVDDYDAGTRFGEWETRGSMLKKLAPISPAVRGKTVDNNTQREAIFRGSACNQEQTGSRVVSYGVRFWVKSTWAVAYKQAGSLFEQQAWLPLVCSHAAKSGRGRRFTTRGKDPIARSTPVFAPVMVVAGAMLALVLAIDIDQTKQSTEAGAGNN